MIAQAAVFRSHQEDMRIESIEIPELKEGEILVEIAMCAICRSDLHTFAGRRIEPTPTILGHEIAGRIVEFGPNAPQADFRGVPLQIGSRVTWSITVGCGECTACERGLPQKCLTLFKYGHRRLSDSDTLSGGFASNVILRRGTDMFFVPDQVEDRLAALASCSTATAASVLRAAGPVMGRSVLIFGAGVLGVTATAMASSNGAAEVIVSDPCPLNLGRALDFGATRLAGNSERADIVLELSGSVSAAELAVESANVGGTIVLAGTVSPVGSISIDPEKLVRNCQSIRGVHNYHPSDLGSALDFLAAAGKSFPFDQLFDQTYRLSEISTALHDSQGKQGKRCLVIP